MNDNTIQNRATNDIGCNLIGEKSAPIPIPAAYDLGHKFHTHKVALISIVLESLLPI
jgi:hypothetical protein